MFLLLTTACWLNKDAESGPHCEDTATVVALDEETALGFSAQALLDLAEGETAALLSWSEGGDTPLTLAVTHEGGEARYVDSEAVYPESDEPTPAIGVECPDRVEVDVALDFASEDGAFDERWELALVGTSAEQADFDQELDPDGLDGSFDLQPLLEADGYVEGEIDSLDLHARGSFDEGGSTGTLNALISGVEECDEDDEECVAWASSLDVASWAPEGAEE